MMNRINAKAQELNVQLFYDISFANEYDAVVYSINPAFINWLEENATEKKVDRYNTYYMIDNMTIKIVDDEF